MAGGVQASKLTLISVIKESFTGENMEADLNISISLLKGEIILIEKMRDANTGGGVDEYSKRMQDYRDRIESYMAAVRELELTQASLQMPKLPDLSFLEELEILFKRKTPNNPSLSKRELTFDQRLAAHMEGSLSVFLKMIEERKFHFPVAS